MSGFSAQYRFSQYHNVNLTYLAGSPDIAFLLSAAKLIRPLFKLKAKCIIGFVLAAIFLAPPGTFAASATWNGTKDANWATTTDWSVSPLPGTGDTATFNNAGNGNTTLNLGGGVTIKTILFDTTGAAAYTIGSGAVGSQTLTLNSAGALTMNSTVVNNQLFNANLTLSGSAAFTNNSSASLTLAGVLNDGTAGTLIVSGTGNITISNNLTPTAALALVKSGTGALTLSGAGTSTLGNVMVTNGQMTVAAGIVSVNDTTGASTKVDYTGAMVISGGTVNIHGTGGWFPIGDTAGHTATLTINSGAVNVTDNFGTEVGRLGFGILTLNGGTFLNNDTANVGFIVGDNAAPGGSANPGGMVNLNGGTLEANTIIYHAGSSQFYFNGGTLSPTASRTDWFPSNGGLVTQVRNGGAIINDRGLTVTITQNLAHSTLGGDNAVDGGLTKMGAGTVTLAGANTYTGDTVISNGVLALAAGSFMISSNIIINGSATFNVSAVSGYALGVNQTLQGGGLVNGSVNTLSGSAIYPGTNGGYGTLTFNNSLTLASGATANFDLSNAYNGVNDQINSGLLTLNGNAFHIKAPDTSTSLDSSADYVLIAASEIVGSFASTPVWDVKPINFANFSIVTDQINNQVRLHYSALIPPTGNGLASPSTATNNQNVLVSVTVTPGSGSIDPNTGVTLNASIINGSPSMPLVLSSMANVYTNTLTVPSSAAGGSYTLTATITDSNGQSGTANISLNVATMVPLNATVGQAEGPFPLYGSYFIHDPGTLIKQGNSYFIYGDGQGISGLTSTDLRNWVDTSAIFPQGPPPWTSNAVPGFTGYFWAPDIAYFNGSYHLYYACSIFGTINSAIGLVTTPSLIAPVWTDQGKVIQSNPSFATNATTDLTAYNCIDPSVMVDTNGTVWLAFGSYSDGILIMQLDPATGNRISHNSPLARVSNNGPVFFSNSEEGACLYQRGGFYYLFVNFGGCCAGVNSTYNIRVGRSTAVTGPYFDQNGVNMISGGGTMVLESTARYIGPGHAAIMNDNGTNWFTFHYYDGNNNGDATLGLMKINWTPDGWPALTNDWSAFYTFHTDAREHLGLYNGTLKNKAAITNDPSFGNVLNLDGVTNYAVLPNPMANCKTIAAWVNWGGGAAGQHLFDFGTDRTNYFYLTPQSSSGTMCFAITTNGPAGEKQISAPFAMPVNSWCHVAVTLDGSQGLLYLDGVPVATNSNLTVRPWQTGWESAQDEVVQTNLIGKSKFAGAPLFKGEISSLRIFGRALGGTEIQGIAAANPALAHRYSFTNYVWDSIGMAHGTLLGNATVTNGALVLNGATGGYANLPGGLVSGSSATTIEFWAAFGANASSARVFDFGNINGGSGVQYLYFSPHDTTSAQHLEISTNLTIATTAPGTLDNQAVFVACIVDPANSYMAIYTNGVLESAKTATLPPLTGVSTAWSFIGHSLFSADPYLNAAIDEFRIYDGRLTPQQIATDFQFGPASSALSVPLGLSNTPGNTLLSWPSWAIGFSLLSSTNLTRGVWTLVPQSPVLTNNQWQLNLVTTNPAIFYRLQR